MPTRTAHAHAADMFGAMRASADSEQAAMEAMLARKSADPSISKTGAAMIINIGDDYRIRRYDARNWTLDQFKAPDPNNRFTKGTDPRWVHIGVYFGTLDAALRWAYEHALLADRSEEELSLKEALDRAEAIAEGLKTGIEIDLQATAQATEEEPAEDGEGEPEEGPDAL